MATNEDHFDMELFIEEVHNLPSVWDYTSDGYSNRVEKARAWESLCSKFYDNFEVRDAKDKNECTAKLQRKWRSLRDSYNRELKKSKNGSSGRRPYIYFSNLYFLKPLSEKRAAESSISDSEQDEDEEFITPNPIPENQKATKRKVSDSSSREQDCERIKKPAIRLPDPINNHDIPVGHIDSDLHFLLSLYDRFKAIDNHLKLQAQIEILNVIQTYSQPHPSVHDYDSFGRGHDDQL